MAPRHPMHRGRKDDSRSVAIAQRQHPQRSLPHRRGHPFRGEDVPDVLVLLQGQQRLSREHKPRILAGLGNLAYLQEIEVERGVDLDWWEETPVSGDVKVKSRSAGGGQARGPRGGFASGGEHVCGGGDRVGQSAVDKAHGAVRGGSGRRPERRGD